jgi:hypothetical protein
MPKMSKSAANAALDALTALVNAGGAGTLTVHTGSQPSETAVGNSGTLLATLGLSADAFGTASSSGSAARSIANTITSPSGGAVAAGVPGYYRVRSSNGDVVFQGSAGGASSGSELAFSFSPFTVGGVVAVSSLTIYLPE